MSPQHRASPHNTSQPGEEGSAHDKKKMKTMLQRRRTAQSVISRALSKPRAHSRTGVSTERRPWNVNQPDVSATHDSFFVMEEHVHLTNGQQTQERHLFLFTDVLIIAKSKSSASLKVKAQVRLSEMWLASCVEQVTERKLSSKNSFVIGWPTTNYVVTLSSTEAKEKWFSALKWYIIQSKQNELPSKIVMRVTVLDGSVTTTALQLDSSTTAENVIQMIALQHGLKGPTAEYQLWVETAGEETPCVLIGHELPYAIILHHLRLSECLSAVRSSLLTAEGTLHLELMPREVPVPLFTLRNSGTRHAHAQSDLSQKHRRKKSLIDWALRRGGSSQASCSLESPSSALFGQPLSSICSHGNPPPPVLDMLHILYQQGPATQGIFRRSASAKSCRELKEKLHAGMAYLPEGESLFVVAAVLTDFLRSLPDSVLGSHLYERWMEVAQAEEKEERNVVMASLVAELPEENGTLLRYLFWVLYQIHQRSEENQMSAFNLALCIAPNMLMPPSSSSSEEETSAMKKVAELIQLLIENTPSIFGEDVGGLLSRWRAVRDEQASSAQTETDLHANWRGQRSPSPASLLLPDPFLIPLATLALREDDGFIVPSVSGSSVSVCSLPTRMGHLWWSRDRCASEPTVCPVPPHSSVARQSSCDAAVTGDSFSQSQSPGAQVRRPQAKQKSWRADSSPRAGAGVGKGRYTLWRSPQTAPRFRHAAGLLPSPSSLPSTATSSLSSLDSALSLSSSEPLCSPNDTTARPFLFGAAARLRPLTPDVPRKFPQDWSMTFPQERQKNSRGEEETCEEEDEEKEAKSWELHAGGTRMTHDEEVEEERVKREEREERTLMMEPPTHHTGVIGSQWRHLSDVRMTVRPATPPDGDGEQVPCESQGSEGGGQHSIIRPRVQGRVRETSVAHIKLSSSGAPLPTSPQTPACASLPEVENVQRTKITFYASSATLTVNEPASQQVANEAGDPLGTPGPVNPQNHTVQVHIPQAVFYGQSAPLVLRSVSTRAPASTHPAAARHSGPTTHTCITLSGAVNVSHVCHGTEGAAVNGCEVVRGETGTDADSQGVIGSGSGVGVVVGVTGASPRYCADPRNSACQGSPRKQHSTSGSASIRHTIRIKLPAAVRNTVREYFSHREADNAHTASVEKGLVINRLQWQQSNPHCSPPDACPVSESSNRE
ncbi:hypothetical protein ACEWY4_009405 [Coilia grayii]|uniref:Rho GTPase-activating protein 20 n=1 Tax=Coilia grayii TaxID=363190 RepID=A0ABD1K6B2_9TELE